MDTPWKRQGILVGDFYSGKSSLHKRLEFGSWEHSQGAAPINPLRVLDKTISFKHVIDCVDGDYKIKFRLKDVKRQDQFSVKLSNSYCRWSDCIIIMYDITNKESFNNAKTWLEQWLEYCMQYTNPDYSKVSIAIVGNKLDLHEQRQVTTEKLHQFCKSYQQNDYFIVNKKLHKSRPHLLCYGYITECNLYIPMDIYNLCFKFYNCAAYSIINPFEISVKSGDGVNEMLDKLLKVMLEIEYYNGRVQHYKPNDKSNACKQCTYL